MSDVVVLRRESVLSFVRADPTAPLVTERSTPTVVIQREGIPGTRGPAGPPGTVGQPFVFTPPDVQVQWTIVHNLNRKPIVTVIDTLQRLIYPDVSYLDDNIVQLNFAIPMTGTAFLN